MLEEGEKRAQEAEQLRQELIEARIAEKQIREKLNQFIHSDNHSTMNSIDVFNSKSSVISPLLLGSSILNVPSVGHGSPPPYSQSVR